MNDQEDADDIKAAVAEIAIGQVDGQPARSDATASTTTTKETHHGR